MSSSVISACLRTTRRVGFDGGCHSVLLGTAWATLLRWSFLVNRSFCSPIRRRDAHIASYRSSNGELNWRQSRGVLFGWSTPVFYQPQGSGLQIVTATSSQVNAHSAATGDSLWVFSGTSPSVIASPFVADDTVYSFGYGIQTAPLFSTQSKYDKNEDGQISPEEYGDVALLVTIGKHFAEANRYVTQEAWDKFFRSHDKPSNLVAVRLNPGDHGASRAMAPRDEFLRRGAFADCGGRHSVRR